MDAKVEFQKVVKDVVASTREFAALGLSYTSKALELAICNLKKAEETIKTQAEKLQPDKPADAPPVSDQKQS